MKYIYWVLQPVAGLGTDDHQSRSFNGCKTPNIEHSQPITWLILAKLHITTTNNNKKLVNYQDIYKLKIMKPNSAAKTLHAIWPALDQAFPTDPHPSGIRILTHQQNSVVKKTQLLTKHVTATYRVPRAADLHLSWRIVRQSKRGDCFTDDRLSVTGRLQLPAMRTKVMLPWRQVSSQIMAVLVDLYAQQA